MPKIIGVLLVALLLISALPLLTLGSSEILIPGIVDDYVHVYRDSWGVPHIYATSTSDAYFALGYVMAQDRLFEMDLFRRSVAGRVAEILGTPAFSQDVVMRTLGVYQIAVDTWNGIYPNAVVPPDIRQNLIQFSNGVNKYIASLVPFIPFPPFPLEYRTLQILTQLPYSQFIPYPWTPTDSLAIAGMMGLMLTDTSQGEIIRGAYAAMVDPAFYSQTGLPLVSDFLMPTSWQNATTISMPDPELESVGLIEAITAPIRKLLGFSGLEGSNNWVISGTNTTTGNAMLANDPHLALQSPGINWQVHINVPGWANVIGCCIPGGPVIYTGHNDYISFGVTNLMADVMDLYYYTSNATHYWYEPLGQWLPFNVNMVTIYNYTQPITIPVVSTIHGPLISTPLPAPFNKMAVKWAGKLSGYGEVVGFSLVDNATSLAEWQQALSHMCVIDQNYVAADKNGNIAYCPSGKLPLRPPPPPLGTGTLGVVPSNGSAGQNEWMGWLPHSTSPQIIPPYPIPVSLPYIQNPPQGFIATANNQPIDPSYPGYPWPIWIGPAFGFDPGYRAQRITELIKTLAPIDIEDMKLIQADSVCIPARNMVPILLGALAGDSNATIQQALAILAGWNYSELRGLVAPLIWELFLEKYTYNTFYDEFGPYGLYPFPNTIIPLWNMTIDTVTKLPGANMYALVLFDNKFTPSPGPGYPGWETMPDIMNKSLHDAIDWIAGQLGSDMSTWQYGKLHVVNFAHTMGGSLPYLNVPAMPVGCDGGPYTVDPGGHHHELIVKQVLHVGSGASYRGIYECKDDWDTSLILVPPGENGLVTGHPQAPIFNPHYGDTFLMWLNNLYTPCLFDDAYIQTNYESHTIFYPAIHNVAVTAITPSSTRVAIGTTIQVYVTVKNEGIYNETFTVTLSYDSNVISTQTVTDLMPGKTKSLIFNWNTMGVLPNDYIITANASQVPGEVYLVDNTKTTTVRVGVAPTIKVDPHISNMQMINKTFNVNITINDLGGYWKTVGIQFRLTYDETLIEFVDIAEGPFMKDPMWNKHGTYFIFYEEPYPPYGRSVVAAVMLLPNATGYWNYFPSGSGVVATITFKVIYQERGLANPPQTCDLRLFETIVLDNEGLRIPHNIQDGIYNIYPTHDGDIDFDNKVDMVDLWKVAMAFGSLPGQERWDPSCDTNKDDKIDMRDMWTVATGFGWIPTYDP